MKEFRTDSEIEVEALYTPDHLEGFDYREKLGFPGEPPYTRGVYPTMYRGRLWTMRQYAGFGDAEETNRRFKYLVEQGQTGLSVAFDLPTQLGYDSDHPLAEGEVGRCGVAIDSLEDMELLFRGIPLGWVSTSMTINAPAMVLLAMYLVVAKGQGAPRERLSGTVQNDILKEYIARGNYIFPPGPSLRLAAELIAWCAENLPRWNPISISGYHIREAGATAVQELAFTLADGLAYIEAALAQGAPLERFAPRLSFFFSSDRNFFEEIAKFRAARRLWARIMEERFGTAAPLRFHTQTAGSTLTAQQPLNNIVRVTLQALAAVLGGTQSLHTNSYDEALGLPTEEAVRIALRTQQLIAEESGVADTVDPLGGSYYLEWLTDRLEEEARKYIDKIDSLGGMVEAIEGGYIQREIQRSAYRKQQEVERGERVIVGVNRFTSGDGQRVRAMEVDPRVRERQCARLERLRKERDNDRVARALERLQERAAAGGEVMEAILEAVRAKATLGEICDRLRAELGEYEAPPLF